MTISFTEDELKWIKMDKFNWKIKKDCPKNIKRRLQKKINMFYDEEHYGYKDYGKGHK